MNQDNLMLSKEEKKVLYERIFAGDDSARIELAARYLPFATKYAIKEMKRRKLDPAHTKDLIATCILGLFEAIKKFKPEFGTDVSTHARNYLKNEIDKYVGQMLSGTSCGGPVIAKLTRVHAARSALQKANEAVTPQRLSQQARVPLSFARSFLENRVSVPPALSLSVPINDSFDGGDTTWQDQLVDDVPSVEVVVLENEQSSILTGALATLSERERFIIMNRHYTSEEMTLEMLGQQLELSKERVRQIEVKALEKLQKHLKKKYKAHSFADLAGP